MRLQQMHRFTIRRCALNTLSFPEAPISQSFSCPVITACSASP